MPRFWFVSGVKFEARLPPAVAFFGGEETSMFDVYAWTYTHADLPKIKEYALTAIADEYPLTKAGSQALYDRLMETRRHSRVVFATILYHQLLYQEQTELVWESGYCERWQGWEAAADNSWSHKRTITIDELQAELGISWLFTPVGLQTLPNSLPQT